MKTYKDYGNSPVITLSNGITVSKISLTRNSVPNNYFNVKVNIASSENANNALLTRRYNQFNPYKRPFIRSTEEEKAMVKDTMEFQNCVIFLRESGDEEHTEFADKNYHFYAFGNIGDSKKTDKTRLTDPSDKYECILEVMDNTLPLSTMPTGQVDADGTPIYPINASDWKAGNTAYDALQAELFDEKKATDKDNGLADTYGWRYIYEDGTDEENAEVRTFVENKWREFYRFVVTSTDEEFKAHLGDYCVLDSVMYYYLFTLRYTMTDNHAKNSFWHYGKSNDLDASGNPIRKFDLAFGYDFDTAAGIDNYGRMSYRYGYEEIDFVDGTQDWVWNAPQHVFFLRLRKLFDAELCALYTKLEGEGAWSSSSFINQYRNWQNQFPEELWRVDINRKYIRTYTSSYINGEAKPEFFKERMNGRKLYWFINYERKQEKYMSSKFIGTVAASDDIILRCSVPNTYLEVPANFDITLVPYSYVYLNVKYNTSPPIKVRAVPGQSYTIKYDAELADIIEIYSASCLKSIGDLSDKYLINGDFSNATKIRELILGNATEGYANTNSITLGFGSNGLLLKLDIQNMTGLTDSLDVSGLRNLEELYAFGSGITGVIFAEGGNISIAQIPGVGSLSMKNLNSLTDDGFMMSSYDKLTKFIAEYLQLDLIEILNKASNLYQVRLVGVDWRLENTDLLERIYELEGVNNTGGNASDSVLSGTVYIPSIGQRDLYKYQQKWPDLNITYTTLISQYTVTFKNTDGTILDVQYVNIGEAAEDPVTRKENPIATPTQESTAEHNFTFAGWDLSLSGIFTDRTITATYTATVRSYTIKYVSKGTVLQEDVGNYGDVILYRGDIPTYTLEESAYVYYLFNRWDKSGYIDGDKTVNAIYDSCSYLEGYFDGKELKDLTPVEIYALTKAGVADSVITDKDPYDVQIGHDYDFDDVQSYTFIDEETVFDGTNHLDTGISLFDIDRDFVFVIDYKIKAGNTTGATMCQCYNFNGSNGFRLWYNTSPRITWGTQFVTTAAVGTRNLVVFQHKRGDTNITVYEANSLDNLQPTVTTIEMTKESLGNNKLVIGAARADDGIYENHCIGTVYWAKLWMGNIGDELCKNLALWTHQTMPMEAAGLRRYYLSDNSNQRCTFTLIAKYLLDQTKRINTTATNAGGWKSAELCAWLNERLYKAFPSQIRALLKQCKIPSSLGERSTEIVYADCYVTIPSYIELVSTTGEVLINEGNTISFMITNDERGRTYLTDPAEFKTYWYRSPFLNNNTSFYYFYVWYNSSNNTYNYNATSSANASDVRGVLIMISF